MVPFDPNSCSAGEPPMGEFPDEGPSEWVGGASTEWGAGGSDTAPGPQQTQGPTCSKPPPDCYASCRAADAEQTKNHIHCGGTLVTKTAVHPCAILLVL